MSEDLQLTPPRVPLIDPKTGLATREFYNFLLKLFNRVGGTAGFSNQEIFGDYVAESGYDELLQRVGSVEAQLQGQIASNQLENTLQRLGSIEAQLQGMASTLREVMVLTFDSGISSQSIAPLPDIVDRLKVRVSFTSEGSTTVQDISAKNATLSANLAAVNGAFSGNVSGAEATFTGADVSSTYKVGGTQVVTSRQAAVADATGGATIDAEARTAINAALARLRIHGLIST